MQFFQNSRVRISIGPFRQPATIQPDSPASAGTGVAFSNGKEISKRRTPPMTERLMADQQWNPWELATIGLMMVLATALLTGVVVAHYAGDDTPIPTARVSSNLPEQTGSPPARALLQVGPLPPPLQSPPTPAEHDQQVSAAPPDQHAAASHAPAQPTARDITVCNHYAGAIGRNKTAQTLTTALIGGALGAGLGAAGGAIAGGGGGAGKGAGIGGLVGVAAGTVYGLNEANRNDARAAAGYRACMKRRGYSD
jgi:hypothetical protein